MQTDLAAIAATSLIDGKVRGMPSGVKPMTLTEVGQQGWSVPAEDLCLPILTVSDDAFAHNVATINAYAADHGLYLCAHGKTMMAPQLLARVLTGSRTVGLCAATTQQAAVMAACGAPNVFIANQVVGRANLQMLAELVREYSETRFLVLVDSPESIEQLSFHTATHLGKAHSIDVLIEVGVCGGRAGVRKLAAAQELIDLLLQHSEAGGRLRLAGVSTYEGAVPAGADAAANIDGLFELTGQVYDAAAPVVPKDGQAPILSAGGSATFDLVTKAFAGRRYEVAPRIWLRPGVAPTFDHVVYQERLEQMDERSGFVMGGVVKSAVAAFEPALALWAAVQSILDDDTALLAAGIRDFPVDAGYPTLLAHYRRGVLLAGYSPGQHNLTKANDQHGYLPLGGLDLRVGDVLKLGISHPCTAFDRWPILFTVDSNERVTGAVKTYF